MGDINIYEDDLISISQAARKLPTKPAPATIWRWHAKGVNRIKLETVVVGGKRYTTEKAFVEFVRAVTKAADESQDERRRKNDDSVHEELETRGLL